MCRSTMVSQLKNKMPIRDIPDNDNQLAIQQAVFSMHAARTLFNYYFRCGKVMFSVVCVCVCVCAGGGGGGGCPIASWHRTHTVNPAEETGSGGCGVPV